MRGGPSGERCADCYFFQLAYDVERCGSRDEAVARSEHEVGYAGYCHRFPPTVLLGEDRDGFFPISVACGDNWCGEFKERK